MKIIAFLSILLLFVIPSQAFSSFDFEINKKSVVSISTKNKFYFGWNQAGSFNGTGFIVDLGQRYIVTNKHVVNEYPMQIRVEFYDKTTSNAKLIYSDIFHDFSILQFEKNDLTRPLKAVTLGNYFDLKVKDKLYLIGNNESDGLTIKQGIAVNLRKNKGARHSLTLQTSFDRTGGSSGSPVFDTKGEVIGIHFKGTNTSSFELAINYVKDVLEKLKKKEAIKRRDLGLRLQYISVDEACQFLNFDKKLIKEFSNKNNVSAQMIVVKQLAPSSLAQSKLRVGDIILEINGLKLGDNLYLFDKEVDRKELVKLTIFRQGKILNVELKSKSYQKERISKFITFGGALFHPINNNVRISWDIDGQGVYLPQVFPGSSFDSVGYSSSKNKVRKGVVVQYVNGIKVMNLDHLEKIFRNLKDGSKISITYKDYYNSSSPLMKFLTLDLSTFAQKRYSFDSSQHKWVSVKLNSK